MRQSCVFSTSQDFDNHFLS